MLELAGNWGPADREETRYYGKKAAAPNLWRAVLSLLACTLSASCTMPGGLLAGGGDAAGWDCTPLDPLRGELPAQPCFRATLSDHNLVTVEWRVQGSSGLVYLADALGPDYNDPGYQPAVCADVARRGCRYTQRVGTGGFHRWQLRVSAPSGEQLFAATTLAVPAPFPPKLQGGGALDVLAPDPAPVTWEADSRNAPYTATQRAAWVTVQDPATGNWPYGELWPRTGPGANYPVTADMLNAAGEVNITVRDCRLIGKTTSRLCSDNAWAGFYTSGDYFVVDNPLYIESGAAPTLGFTTHAGEFRELESATVLPQGPVRTRGGEITLTPQRLTPGEHRLALRSCAGDTCAEPHRLRIIVDGAVNWETGRDFERDFYPARTHNLFGKGVPLDITWSARGDIWMTREFSNSLTHIDATHNVDAYEVPLARRARFSSANPAPTKPFGLNFGSIGRIPSSGSALAEKVIEAWGKLWFTQGGGRYEEEVQDGVNFSRVVSFDAAAKDLPTTAQDDRFCVYAMPPAPDSEAGDNHVLGVAAAHGRIWVAEMRGLRSQRPGAISSFLPSAVSCRNDIDYSDPRSRNSPMPYCSDGESATAGCVESWPLDEAKPAMLEPDPADGSLWFTDTSGVYLGNFDPGRDQPVTLYPIPEPGSINWSIRLDADAVYFAAYGSRTLYRFDKRARTFHTIPIPSPATKGALLHTIDIDHRQRRLWFTLTNEGLVPHQADASTIGYIDLDSWRDRAGSDSTGSAAGQVRGVVYAGLDRAPYPERSPPRHQSFHGIAVEPATGRLAIATMWRNQVTELTPRPEFVPAN